VASTPEGTAWWDDRPEQLADVLTRIRGRGWTIEDLALDVANEVVKFTVGYLDSPPGTLSVTLPPGYPTVAAPIQGPKGLDEHVHLADGTLCLPAELTDAVALLDAALNLYAVGQQGRDALRALGVGSAEPRPGYISVRPLHAVSLAVPVPEGEWGTFTLLGALAANSLRGAITEVSSNGTTEPAEASATLCDNLAETHDAGFRRHEFLWWRTDVQDFPTAGTALESFWRRGLPEAARARLAKYEHPHPKSGRKRRRPKADIRLYGLVVPEEGPANGQWHERVLVIAARGDNITVVPVATFADSAARVPGAEVLRTKTVAVAGLGMLGGNLVLDLARTGIGALRLADHDTVELGNLVRQPYDVTDVGDAKVDALRRHLQRAAPQCSVPRNQLLSRRIGGAATRGEVREWLTGCDLLVMVTGDHNAELHLTDVAEEVGVPVVCGWVSLGIWGSLALVTRWGKSGCIWCLDQRRGELAVLAEPPAAQALFVPGCGYPTFPGNVIDGHIAASTIGRLVLDALLGQRSPGDLAVTTLRSTAGHVGPETTFSVLPPDLTCPVCSR
jgi:hypothetical protein